MLLQQSTTYLYNGAPLTTGPPSNQTRGSYDQDQRELQQAAIFIPLF